MPTLPARILITGANGNLGRRLIARLEGGRGGDTQAGDEPAVQADRSAVRALVRSERAAGQVRAAYEADAEPDRAPEIVIADYGDADAMARAQAGCDAVVHLVGIIKEGRTTRYASAHEGTCEVLARTAGPAGVRRIVYLGIVGASPDSPNACLASKGRAERILLGGGVPATVVRVPMVLGPGDAATRGLRAQARARWLPLVGGGATLQQPIDAEDVVDAVLGALATGAESNEALDLGGPECLTHRALVERAAALHGNTPRIVPIPLSLARLGVAVLERLSADPPVTRAMLGVLQHDDRVDVKTACERLGVRLTPLDVTLQRYVGPETDPDA